jgi:hypothetical protein
MSALGQSDLFKVWVRAAFYPTFDFAQWRIMLVVFQAQ